MRMLYTKPLIIYNFYHWANPPFSDEAGRVSHKKSSSSLRSAKLINLSQKSLDFTDDELVESIHEMVKK